MTDVLDQPISAEPAAAWQTIDAQAFRFEQLNMLYRQLSAVSFLATLAVIPWLVVRLPADYFAKPTRYPLITRKLPGGMHYVVLLLKNLFGVLIVALGVVMLVIPGQGLLTIVIGLILLDFPGKYRLQRNLIQRKPVLKSVNWLRERGEQAPLMFGDHTP